MASPMPPRAGYDLESLAFDALTVLAANGWGTDAGGPPAVVAGHGVWRDRCVRRWLPSNPSRSPAWRLVDFGWEEMRGRHRA